MRHAVSRRPRVVLALLGLGFMVAAGAGLYVANSARTAAPPAVELAGIAWSNAPQPIADVQFLGAGPRSHALADFRGKVVLLNIWATWCGPCREEMPALDRLQRKLGGAGFEVVALSIDSGGLEAVRRFYEEVGIRALAPYVDPSMRAGAALRVVGVPTTLLLDREGRERWRKTGPEQWDSPAIADALRSHLERR